jgi:hypothetical protein
MLSGRVANRYIAIASVSAICRLASASSRCAKAWSSALDTQRVITSVSSDSARITTKVSTSAKPASYPLSAGLDGGGS